jgi:RNA polymerase sigma-70 factor, ECF subfamily
MAFTIAFRIVRNRQDAEEVVQDSFLKAFRSLGSFQKNSSFSTWLYRIVYNTSVSRLRYKNSRQDLFARELNEDLAEPAGNAYFSLTNAEQTKYIGMALEQLDNDDNLILILYYLEEKSLDEISEITSWPRDNLKMKLYRARKKLYASLYKILKQETKNLL